VGVKQGVRGCLSAVTLRASDACVGGRWDQAYSFATSQTQLRAVNIEARKHVDYVLPFAAEQDVNRDEPALSSSDSAPTLFIGTLLMVRIGKESTGVCFLS
jgi:hypothetical protein